MQIQNATVLVTGANRGLGRAFVQALQERGARKVYAAARDPRTIALPGVVPVRLDVTNSADIEALAREATDLTLVINNAGIVERAPLASDDVVAAARRELETNYVGPLALTHALAPTLATHGGGAIVNVLSVLSWVAFPGSITYSGSKAAAWALTNGIRNELRGQGTQVVAVHVGYMDTDMAREVTAPKSDPRDVVRATLDAVERGDSEVLADDVSRTVHQHLTAGVYLTNPGAAR